MTHPSRNLTSALRFRGFSLIEVLVAIFVFAVGILSIAGLQAVTKHANNEAVQRTTATMLANEMLERMRANPGALTFYVTGATNGITSATDVPATLASVTEKSCVGATTCTHPELALADLVLWQDSIIGASEQVTNPENAAETLNVGGLEDPTACIRGPAAGGSGMYRVVIVWRGATELTIPAGSPAALEPCGQDAARYGTNNVYRRLLIVDTFIDA